MLSQLTHCRSWESIDLIGSVQIDAANVSGLFSSFFLPSQKANASRSV